MAELMIPRHGAGSPGFTKTLVEYHRRCQRRYEAACWRPWLALEPDPPPPVAPGDDGESADERLDRLARQVGL